MKSNSLTKSLCLGAGFAVLLIVIVWGVVLKIDADNHDKALQYEAERYKRFPACQNVDFHDKEAMSYCEILDRLETKISASEGLSSAYYQVEKKIENILEEVKFHQQHMSDAPLYLQKRQGELIVQKLQNLGNDYTGTGQCMNVWSHYSDYDVLADGLTKCLVDYDNSTKFFNEATKLKALLNKYKYLSPRSKNDLDKELEEISMH